MRWATALVLASSLTAFAGDKKDKAKPAPVDKIDSGSFGVFIRGQRVATETFSVHQDNGVSVIKAELKETTGSASQKSDLELGPKGDLLRYEWSQASGGSLTVFPDNEFLKERITATPGAKAAEQAFLLPSVTTILDNNFFVQREVLAWKYLNGACQATGGDLKCRQEAADFGTLVPQDRTSMPVRIEVVGKEKVTIRGAQRELLRLNLSGDSFAWNLWVDDQDHFKLIRVAIPADDTEVVRD
jgi:hypothetical protein